MYLTKYSFILQRIFLLSHAGNIMGAGVWIALMKRKNKKDCEQKANIIAN